MPQKTCRKCNRQIYDTEKLDELPNTLECQHCHHVNIIRRAKPKKKRRLVPKPAEVTPEPEPRKVAFISRIPKSKVRKTEEPAAAVTPEPEPVTGYGTWPSTGANTDELPSAMEPEFIRQPPEEV